MARRYQGPIVDTDIHHSWPSSKVILEYMPSRWRDLVEANEDVKRLGISGRRATGLPGNGGAGTGVISIPTEKGGTMPRDGVSLLASDYELLKEQLLDEFNIWRGVITYNIGGHVHTLNRDFAVDLQRAVHDWNADTWLTWDDRLYGVVCPVMSDPHEGAKEIRRAGAHERIVAVLFSGTPVNLPYGDRFYHPLYEAAAELDLPIDVHPAGTVAVRPPGGFSSYGSTYAALLTHEPLHHITSLIVNGVFEKFPGLKFQIKEYNIAWLPYLMWRLDEHYELLKLESPWVKRWPSEYVRDHIVLDTQPLDEGRTPDELKDVLESVDGLDDLLCFATDYPHAAMDDPNYVARRIPDGWARKVMCDNACRYYGWTPPPPDAVFEQPLAAAAGA
jgi:predicted TIM-barrel fold metal-dependent hydrolase